MTASFKSEKDCLSFLNKQNLHGDKFGCSMNALKSSADGWISLRSYREFMFERKLQARYLTNFDSSFEQNAIAKKSAFFTYSEAKTKFLNSLEN